MNNHGLTVRAATPQDCDALARLAGLNCRPQLRGPALLAERDAVAIAAIALTSGSVVTDPVQATADTQRLLRRRRYGLMRQGGDVGLLGTLMRRLAPQSGVLA